MKKTAKIMALSSILLASFSAVADLQEPEENCHFSIAKPEHYYAHQKTKYNGKTGEHWKLMIDGKTIASKDHEIFGVTPQGASAIPKMLPGERHEVNGAQYYIKNAEPDATQRAAADWSQDLYAVCTD